MRFGVVILPEAPWAKAASLWRRAEHLGFDHAWTYDHLAWRMFRDEPWFTAVPVLAAAAAATSKIRIGTLVASPNFRHPLTLAKDFIALDDVSQGRVTLGVGAGGRGWDATMLGQKEWSRKERTDRFAEFVELLDLLLLEPEVTWHGSYYAVEEARTYPGCTQKPRLPLAVAAGAPRGLAVAARFADTWVTIGDYGEEPLRAREGAQLVARQLELLGDECLKVGRDAADVGRMVLTGLRLDPGLGSAEMFAETVGLYEEAGVTDLVVHWPRASDPYRGDEDSFERILAEHLHA
jgi:alkanesulfonate monooxygenase SsuD/methylene tetrahydromethanopterin reductase-like flavin-dependent oxidoreductase (luciferase family)